MLTRRDNEHIYTVDEMVLDIDVEWIKEDKEGKTTRDLTDAGFYDRYKYEAKIIVENLIKNDRQSILELGSGPGVLAQFILEKHPYIIYDLVDGEGARKVHEIRKYKGNFFVRNLMDSFPTEDLRDDYRLVIIDDFLEHVRNPSAILSGCYDLMAEDAMIFISVPNWRMGHSFFYPGLFDYDNFIKFMMVHRFTPERTYGSPLKAQPHPRLQCEELIDASLLDEWNWYIISRKTK